MKDRWKRKNVLTIPNVLSLIRLLLIPLIVWLYCVKKDYTAAMAAVVVSGLTDIADGKIARKFNMISDVGKVLDPVADKLTQVTLIYCLAFRYPLLWALAVLFVVKECFMLYWGYRTLKMTDQVNGAKWFGKVNTVVLYGVTLILVFFTEIPLYVVNGLIILSAAVMIMSLILYGRFYSGILHKKQEIRIGHRG